MKKFVLKLILVALPVMLLFPYPMWKFSCGECFGDMNVHGTPFFSKSYRSVFSYFPECGKIVTMTDDFSHDAVSLPMDSTILIVGDSFSQQGTRSFMSYLQAQMPEWNVFNVRTMTDNSSWRFIHHSCHEGNDSTLLEFDLMTEYVTYMLRNSPRLPRYVIMESGEFLFVKRMLQTHLDIDDAMLPVFHDTGELRVSATQRSQDAYKEDSFDLSASFAYAHNWIKRFFGVGNHTRHQKLDAPLFTCQGKESDLYFYSDQAKRPKAEDVIAALDVKDALVSLARKRGVELIFMVCPDKLGLYRNHISGIDPKFDFSSFLDIMESEGRADNVVNMKRILLPYVDRGEKDLYYCNDTHWSYKSAEISAKTLEREIKKGHLEIQKIFKPMMFNSIYFAIYLPLVFAIYWLISGKNLKWQNLFIVAASYVFYGAWDWRFLLLIAFTTLCSWTSGVLIADERFQRHAKLITGSNIVVNLFILGIFKYYNFFASSFADLFGLPQEDYVLKNLILPVGISFYTFQALSYSIDVYRQRIEPTRDIVAFFAYVSFFPQLVAGPIERATNLLPQFLGKREFQYDAAVDGCRRMLWGFFKKLVIADNCAVYANYVWADYTNQSGSTLALAAFFFVFQVYGDFSGYSDIAIGCSRLFGIQLRDNFRIPFFSRDIAEFWRRWHISLNTWFVDYLYIPLGGSRRGMMMKIRNTFAIFLASGLWHGANWTYVTWGAFHALCFVPLIVFNRTKVNMGQIAPGKKLPSLKETRGMLLTFILFAISLVIFRAPTISDAWQYMAHIVEVGILSPAYYEKYTVTPALICIVVMMVVEWLQRERRHPLDIAFIPYTWVRVLIYYILVIAIVLYTGQNQTFLYFQF